MTLVQENVETVRRPICRLWQMLFGGTGMTRKRLALVALCIGLTAIAVPAGVQAQKVANPGQFLLQSYQQGVPLTLIFPANQPDAAIPLRGAYSNRTLLTKLREAVEAGNNASGGDGGQMASAPAAATR